MKEKETNRKVGSEEYGHGICLAIEEGQGEFRPVILLHIYSYRTQLVSSTFSLTKKLKH